MFDGATSPRSGGPLRLAIISTFDEVCGIAGYTRALVTQLSPHADVTVFDLDQYLLRSSQQRVQHLADNHIKEIAAQLRNFDSVNIQLEYGTLGKTPRQILRRFKRLVAAAPAVSITFHTILGHEQPDWRAIGLSLITGRLVKMAGILGTFRRNRGLGARVYGFLRARQKIQSLNVVVHTKRDARLLHDVYRIQNVDNHPLSFVSPAQAEAIRATASRDEFPLLKTLPANAKVIGTFGFLSPYKGFETAVRALHYLPEDHHLLIFGGVHPQAIKREQLLDPYIQTLFDEAHIGQTILDTVGLKNTPLSFNIDSISRDLLLRHPSDLGHRVHFLGVHNDEGFMRAMALCDIVVMPYLEVGQSSSGAIALALDMGCRVLASRTLAFLQLARYHPGEIEFFDIGNYAELAGLIQADTPAPGSARHLNYNTTTNTAVYLRASTPRSGVTTKQRHHTNLETVT